MPKDNKFYRKLYPQIIDDIEVRCTDKKLLEVMLRQKKERKLLDKKLLDKKLLSLIPRFYDIM